MAQDDEFIIGRRERKSSGSQGSPKTHTSKRSGQQSTIKLGNMSGSFTKRLAKDMAIAKRSSGRKSYAKPSKPRTGRFNARGRGRTALAAGIGPNRSWQTFDGSSLRYRSRRAVVKVRVMKLRGGKARAAYSHLKYLQREGAGVERTEDRDLTETRGELYGPDRFEDYDDKSFLERGEQSFDGRGDPHQFRLIISPEDGVELARDVYGGPPNLQRQTRKLMEQLSEDLGTRLDWVAVDHFDTAHPHTHVVLRGVTHDGKALNIAGDYIAEGIRGRYEEIITHELGLKCEMDILDDLARETKLNRVTTLDRAIIPRIDAASSVIDLRAGSFSKTATQVSRDVAKDGITVDNMVGVDPVNTIFSNTEGGSTVQNTITVNGVGDGGVNGPNFVEALGKTKAALTGQGGQPAAFRQGNADSYNTITADHGEFGKMFEAGAKVSIDESYK